MIKQTEISLRSSNRTHWIDITDHVSRFITETKINNGICMVFSKHTTAGITINENADPDVQKDFFKQLNQVFPKNPDFAHSEGNSDSHIKASLVGLSVQVPIFNGIVTLGTWQSIYFCEFDGPRNRTFVVSVLGE
jgi:secondary thiamine-phosphate synthase enzyme